MTAIDLPERASLVGELNDSKISKRRNKLDTHELRGLANRKIFSDASDFFQNLKVDENDIPKTDDRGHITLDLSNEKHVKWLED
ncbi:hypothetical protein MKY84_05035 [Chryseomicrobium sp. FSL W7-1435]|uniref:hypothetical protein n=1 Tax=Chryseomicrobium sp. FSL W7-1435 TaxID=2921704 RepID=UPI00315A550D